MNWGMLIVGSFVLVLLAQLAGSIAAFRSGISDGILSLVVPGYVLLALKRSGLYWPVVGVWLAGVVGIATGTIALS